MLVEMNRKRGGGGAAFLEEGDKWRGRGDSMVASRGGGSGLLRLQDEGVFEWSC